MLTNGHVLARFRLCGCARARCCDLTRALTRALTCSCGFTFVRLLVLIRVVRVLVLIHVCALTASLLQSDVVECLFIL